MTSLLDSLNTEISSLDRVGTSSLGALLEESGSVLSDLKQLEAELEDQIINEKNGLVADPQDEKDAYDDFLARTDGRTRSWYKTSIDCLKAYNGQISRFSRTLSSNGGFSVDLDDAYTFPLPLSSVPGATPLETLEKSGETAVLDTAANRTQLMRSIVLHLLKTGHGRIVADLMDQFGLAGEISPDVLQQFIALNDIVDDIRKRHDISRALAWLVKQSSATEEFEQALFKFHMLQFVLLLAGETYLSKDTINEIENTTRNACFGTESALAAYTYAKTHFPALFKDHIDDISPVISLLLFKTTNDSADHVTLLKKKIHQAFLHSCEAKKRHSVETRFVGEILANFDKIHEMDGFFDLLAAEFVKEFCKGLGLSTESSLFQAVLAGHVNLPNFYKYSQLQAKLRRKPDATAGADLPCSLSSRNQFLFTFHPIFICPISKEQLVPLVSVAKVSDADAHDRKRKQIFVSPTEVLVSPSNPVVVFEHCRHLALKESVRHLTKNGAETFKCHYCYKKHKLSDVSEAYFIDL
ncbi:hypothetical protein OXX80_003941 [Metschnikowia pulcherrima]